MTNFIELPENGISKKEVLRYAGCKDGADIDELYSECVSLAKDKLSYRACYIVSDFTINENKVTLPFMETESELLSSYLKNGSQAIFFACTLGSELDRLILKYSKLSPSKALMLQAIGAERIESLADSLEGELKKRYVLTKPRISPGYGDFSIDSQRDILNALSASKLLGMSLSSSMLMSPTKSITAVVATNGEIQ